MNFMTTAEDWHRFGRVPNTNEDVVQGLEYFRIAHFELNEDDGRYSEVPGANGVAEFSNSSEEQWLNLLQCWEDIVVRRFPHLERREDFSVQSHAQRLHSQQTGTQFLNQLLPNGILRSGIKTGASYGKNVSQWSVASYPHDDQLIHRTCLSFIASEKLSIPGLRVQSVALCQPIEATLLHNIGGAAGYHAGHHVPVKNCRLVMWIESRLDGSMFKWRFMGAVYSWKHCRLEPIYNCADVSQHQISALVQPLIREWASLVNMAVDGQLWTPSENPDRPHKPAEEWPSKQGIDL